MDLQILAVNEAGHESALSTMADGGDIPLLQDDADANVWASWSVTYRDVIVLNGDNETVGVYNLTPNDLGEPAKYMALKQLFLDAAN